MTQLSYIHIAFESWAAIFCIIAAACVFATRSFEPKAAYSLIGTLLIDAVLNISETLAYFYHGNATPTGYVMVRLTNFIVFCCGYLLIMFAMAHIERVVVVRGGEQDSSLSYITYGFAAAGVVVLILSRIFGFLYAFDAENNYYRLDSYWLIVALAELAMLPVLIRVIKNRRVFRKPEYIAFLCFAVLPIVGIAVQLMFYGISLYNIANSISLIIIVLAHEIEYSQDTVVRERLRADERIRYYHSQIQPHFIHNSLAVIRSYLPEDSEAREALNHFIGFLRGSIDMLTETECIPARIEFETVDNYLYMEKQRFGDKLTVVTDLQDKKFLLPTFTVQSLVENAIRHGIRENKDGRGTLTIKSYENKREHIIEVVDDGVGFDVSILNGEDEAGAHKHIGLNNLKERLNMMCQGSLEIESAIGEGTLVRVRIPG